MRGHRSGKPIAVESGDELYTTLLNLLWPGSDPRWARAQVETTLSYGHPYHLDCAHITVTDGHAWKVFDLRLTGRRTPTHVVTPAGDMELATLPTSDAKRTPQDKVASMIRGSVTLGRQELAKRLSPAGGGLPRPRAAVAPGVRR